MNKKALELSINFIVMLIISVVVFGSSIMIAKQILDKTKELKNDLDKQTEERIQNLMTTGDEEVVIAFKKKEVDRGDSVVFGIGIANTLGSEKSFLMNVTPGTAIYGNNTVMPPIWELGWGFLPSQDLGKIKNNEFQIFSIPIISSSSAIEGGVYVFDIRVYYLSTSGWKPYPKVDPVQKVRIEIV